MRSLLRKLRLDPELFQEYDNIIQQQIKDGIVEKVTKEATGPKFYIPHKPVIRRDAESTKVRIVYDASAREDSESASLNECIEVGPPLQNLHLGEVLLRNRFRPVIVTSDMKQAFCRFGLEEKIEMF